MSTQDIEPIDSKHDADVAVARSEPKHVDNMTFEDRAAALALANEDDPGLKVFGLRWWRLFGIALVCWMAGGDNGRFLSH